MKKIIYDFGACRGENIDYYLLKSDLVVAFEANPNNSKYIQEKFKQAILDKKLFLENCIVGVEDNLEDQKFYIHKSNYLLGQLPEPSKELLKNFTEIKVQYKNVIQIIKSYGKPHYIKIDLEEYDEIVLKKILSNNIKFEYISVEIKNLNTFNLFDSNLNFNSYKLVDGHNVEYVYKNSKIISDLVKKKYSFPANSAGPFGNDIKGSWITKKNFFELLKFKLEKKGWIDMHCSTIDLPEQEKKFQKYILIEKIKDIKVKYFKKFQRLKIKLNL